MKWLIIFNEGQERDAEKLKSFLSRNKWKSESAMLEKRPFKKDLANLFEKVSASDCSVVFTGAASRLPPQMMFLLGLLTGRGSLSVVIGHSLTLSKFEISPYLKAFPDLRDAEAYLTKNKDRIAEDDKRKRSRESLDSKGIPCNAESFEYYLEKKRPDVCGTMLDAGIDVNACTEDGVPLLSLAVRHNARDVIDYLLEHGADLNAVASDRGYSPVMDAVWLKDYSTTKYLVAKGADLSIMSPDGQSIMVLAVGNGNAKIARVLLEAGADPDMLDNEGMSARGYASLFMNEDLIKLMKKFPPKTS